VLAGAMDSGSVYLVWALGVGAVALVVSGCTYGGLELMVRSPIPLPTWCLVVAVGFATVAHLCAVAMGVLGAMGMSKRFREWVEGGVGRCGRWMRPSF